MDILSLGVSGLALLSVSAAAGFIGDIALFQLAPEYWCKWQEGEAILLAIGGTAAFTAPFLVADRLGVTWTISPWIILAGNAMGLLIAGVLAVASQNSREDERLERRHFR